ncbi:LysR family transcriptional regulator [Enterococcus mediterraneensis]|uniref:LysR family transcriptional regulator n=1 Tax=Enterococcus mediterraneensis TaxID=2364791 RepID=UPI000F0489B1|nr:LysR family transcriptional regulator [Enterococcus mediterraneensis]
MFSLIKTFIAVYETKNFTHAAESLYLAQPTVSSQIKKLESLLGVELFLRKSKHEIIPTPEADFLYPRYLSILKEWQESSERVSQKENFREHCHIAASNTCAIHLLPESIPDLIERFPRVDFQFSMMNSEEVVHQLEQNKADIGLIEKHQQTPILHRELLMKDQLVLAGDPDSEFWIQREQTSGLRVFNDAYLKAHNLTPKIIEVNNNEMVVSMLRQGIGKSIISCLAITEDIPWRPLDDLENRSLYLLTHRKERSQQLQDVAAFLKERFQQ